MQNFNKWAKVYDLIYGEYKEDINFYKKESHKVKGKVLEIACGTGRIYLELLKEDIDAYGIDISHEMLKVLKKKAKKIGLKPKVYKADMKTFKLNKKFSLIIVPFRSFLHNLTIDEQIKTLKNFKKHLTQDGRLIINFFFPDPKIIIKTYNKEQKGIINTKKGRYIALNKSYFIDEPNQIIESITILKKNNKIIWKNKFRITLIYKKEFELLLTFSNFKKWKVYGGYNYQPLKSSKQEMVWVIEK